MAKKLGVNPWLTMWHKPRETVRKIVKYDPKYLVLALVAIGGFANILDSATSTSLGDIIGLPYIFILALVAGPIMGVAMLYITSWLLRVTGKWIGGKASSEHIRTAIAWSTVPAAWALLLWVPELALFGGELFTSETPVLDASPVLIGLFIIFGFVEVAIAIAGVVIFFKALGEVQGFSSWRGLLNTVLVALIIVIPLLAAALVIPQLGLLI